MSLQNSIDPLQAIVRNYPDFPEAVEKAKVALGVVHDTYLQKKIAFLEERSELSADAKHELMQKHKKEQPLMAVANASVKLGHLASKGATIWDTLEESLYLSWTTFHSGKNLDDFYADQKANATVLTGTVEPYPLPVRDKPGDFILKGPNGPIAYLYSVHVDLSKYVGQTVSIVGASRPNHHFAFPAYYALSLE
jgi:hypothetical protein